MAVAAALPPLPPPLPPSAKEAPFPPAPPYAVLDAMAEFRSVHYGWAQEYIDRRTNDPRGTGGTPYMQWLKQLIDETIAFKIN